VYSHIRTTLADYVAQNNIVDLSSEDQVIKSLRERGILEQIISSLDNQKNKAAVNGETQPQNFATQALPMQLATNNGQQKRLLHMKLLGGKAFLEFAAEAEAPKVNGITVLNFYRFLINTIGLFVQQSQKTCSIAVFTSKTNALNR